MPHELANLLTQLSRVRITTTQHLLYAISRDPAEKDKAQRANGILSGHDLALSVQVLCELGPAGGRREADLAVQSEGGQPLARPLGASQQLADISRW